MMRWLTRSGLVFLALNTVLSSAQQLLESNTLLSCAQNTAEIAALSVTRFHVVYTPANNSLFVDIQAVSLISGNVVADVVATAYGYTVYQKTLKGCELGLEGLCPLTSGIIPIQTNIINIDPSALSGIPAIGYSVPDLDGEVKIRLLRAETGEELACFQASLSNGKTVYHKAVGWVSAVIAGLAVLVSAVIAGLGHNTAAAHISANALSLFGMFQHQAIFGMTAVDLPPIVSAWTQNFQWSMGIIRVGFVQDLATWYLRATGGSPSRALNPSYDTLITVQKRSAPAPVGRIADYMEQYVEPNQFLPSSKTLMARQQETLNANTTILRGIERVGYNSGIETTNIFMTGYIIFVAFVMLVLLVVLAFKGALELSRRSGKSVRMSSKFQDFRKGWNTVLKGILLRIALIAFPQIVILCFWELIIARDSAAEMTLAAITVVASIVSLGFACWKIARLAKRSVELHGNAAYILFSDPAVLHKWGFLYIQYRAACCWFTAPWLGFILVLGLFIALAQSATGGMVQSVAILILEAGILVTVAFLRPWMDKKTNTFNISIAAVNFASSLLLLFFTDMFGVPAMVKCVMGVIFFVLNVVFACVLLIMVLVAAAYAAFSKNPDVRYQPMQDDRGSFIKTTANLTDELDALGATARGEGRHEMTDMKSYSSSEIEPSDYDALMAVSMAQLSEKTPQSRRISRQAQSYEGQRMSQEQGQLLTRRRQQLVEDEEELQGTRQHKPGQWQRGAGFD